MHGVVHWVFESDDLIVALMYGSQLYHLIGRYPRFDFLRLKSGSRDIIFRISLSNLGARSRGSDTPPERETRKGLPEVSGLILTV